MGKYRFNKLDFGEVAGLPRLLDVGQCNDVYSAIRIATALANAFEPECAAISGGHFWLAINQQCGG